MPGGTQLALRRQGKGLRVRVPQAPSSPRRQSPTRIVGSATPKAPDTGRRRPSEVLGQWPRWERWLRASHSLESRPPGVHSLGFASPGAYSASVMTIPAKICLGGRDSNGATLGDRKASGPTLSNRKASETATGAWRPRGFDSLQPYEQKSLPLWGGIINMEPEMGIEPITTGLQGRCSTIEPLWRTTEYHSTDFAPVSTKQSTTEPTPDTTHG